MTGGQQIQGRQYRFDGYEPSVLFPGAHWRLKSIGVKTEVEVLVPEDWPKEKQRAVSDYYVAGFKRQKENLERRFLDNERVS